MLRAGKYFISAMTIGIDVSRAYGSKKTGVERYSKELVTSFIKNKRLFRGQRVILFGRGRVKITRLPKRWSFCEIKLPFFWTQLGLLFGLWQKKVDVLLVPGHALPLLGKALTRARLVYVLHGLEMWEVPHCYPWFGRLVGKFLIKACARKADRVLAVSRATKEKAIRYLGVSGEKISVVYEGVVVKKSLRSKSFLESKKRLVRKPYFIFVGRLEKRKNLLRVTRAFNLVKKNWPKLKLILVGPRGYGYEEIKREIEKSKYRADIKETGYLREAEKKRLIVNSRALINVSLAEGFGRPVLEALFLGVPVVVLRIKVFKELYWRELGKRGVVFVKGRKVRSIQKGMEEVLEGKNKLDPAALERLGARHDWKKICRMIRDELVKNVDKN